MSTMTGKEACDGIGAIVLEDKKKGKDKKSGCARSPYQKKSGKAAAKTKKQQAKAETIRKDLRDARKERKKFHQRWRGALKQIQEMKKRWKKKRASLGARNRELRIEIKDKAKQIRAAFGKLHQTLVVASEKIL